MAGGLAPVTLQQVLSLDRFETKELYRGGTIRIGTPESRDHWKPLETVEITLSRPDVASQVRIWDAAGRNYRTLNTDEADQPSSGTGPGLRFRAGGTLGCHKVTLHDRRGELVDWAAFPVDCGTEISDEGGEFSDFMDVLYETLTSGSFGSGRTVRYNHKYYTYYSSWFQDHVFVAEGMKYFREDLKTGIDLYADGQREDGLIWDNYKHPYPELQSYWEYRFDYGGFTYRPEDPRSSAIFVRIPVENIGEHTFLEGLYYAWKATGDDRWMESRLDHALKAVRFATSSPWYWSEEHRLLKRPFSIDRWDFQSDLDARITGKDFMGADLDRTRYGVMFGDNICMANGCGWLAEMLEHSGRREEAEEMRQLGRGLWERINELSWNGDHYVHWVPVENQQELDFGVDTESQVTLSNAMALIRGIDHRKAVQIIDTYRGIREKMPRSSPGEWYMCYPPFEKGWHVKKWEYMNGGVSPILAGDLALGAFIHGRERYGVDILKRLHALAQRNGHRLEGCYKGKIPAPPPERNFTLIDLTGRVNADLVADHPLGGLRFGSPEADLRNLPTGRREFEQVPFEVIDPDSNSRKACLIISGGSEEIGIEAHAKSLYLLHVTDGSGIAGIFRIHYSDGTIHSRYIRDKQEIGHLWYPDIEPARRGIPPLVVAWRGPAARVKEVGIYAFGMDNPHPGKMIDRLEFFNPSSSGWAILGITLSDASHYFTPPIESTIPDHWASAHVIKALIEGLAGIQNTGVAFSRTRLTPRWEAAGTRKVSATAKYVPSGGYSAYRYSKTGDDRYELIFTGSAQETEVECWIPDGKEAGRILLDGSETEFTIRQIGDSRYAVFRAEGPGVHRVDFSLTY